MAFFFMYICGIDEAGRGPLAGPVVVAGVIFDEGKRIEGVKDSKMLSSKVRQELFEKIISSSVAYDIQVIGVDIINRLNILHATMLGMKNCINNLKKVKFSMTYIDGNYFKFEDGFEKTIDYTTVIEGDKKIFCISAASILAKVTRDRIMKIFDSFYPVYNFEKNKGYPTKQHISEVRKSGICEIHREKFCKKFYGNEIIF